MPHTGETPAARPGEAPPAAHPPAAHFPVGNAPEAALRARIRQKDLEISAALAVVIPPNDTMLSAEDFITASYGLLARRSERCKLQIELNELRAHLPEVAPAGGAHFPVGNVPGAAPRVSPWEMFPAPPASGPAFVPTYGLPFAPVWPSPPAPAAHFPVGNVPGSAGNVRGAASRA